MPGPVVLSIGPPHADLPLCIRERACAGVGQSAFCSLMEYLPCRAWISLLFRSLVPLAAILFLKKASMYCFRRNRTLLLQLGSFQAACFLPYALAQAFHEREAHYALIIPFGAGALMFLVTFAYSVHFVVSAIKGHLEEPVC